jgi:hypothetical protein
MKSKFAILLIFAPVLCAGTPEVVTLPPVAEQWITPLIDIRARYEFADVEGFDPSNAFTTRERLGFKSMAWNGFSALVEGEFTQAVIDEYSGGAPHAYPYNTHRSVIADPESNALNQAILQYNGFDTFVKLGRQRIIYDNSAFIGNVGWRQNEQTYDGISLSNKSIDGLTLNYAYINQVNRIYGSEAGGTLENLTGDINLINASYTGISGLTLGGYAYIMNFKNTPGLDNSTFGMSAKGDVLGLTLYGELAWQDDAGAKADNNAMYGHFMATKAFGTQSVTLGLESLGQGFKTPLATLHAFNGFADAFLAGRSAGTQNGLADLYISHTTPIFWGMKWSNVVHAMGDNEISAGYGWEYDSMLTKKFDSNFTAIAQLGYFQSDGDVFVGKSSLPSTTRFSVEMDYTF